MVYTAKKMWQGKVSVRSFIVEYCKKMREPLTIEFQGKRMLVKNLNNYTCDERPQIAQRSDKYIKRGTIYRLYDFEFIPQEDTPLLDYNETGLRRLHEAMKNFFKKKPEQTKLV